MKEKAICNYPLLNCRECKKDLRGTENKDNCIYCGAPRRCGKKGMYGIPRCYIHGGGSYKRNTMIGGSKLKNGKHASIPLVRLTYEITERRKQEMAKLDDLTEKIQEIMGDPELLAHRRPIALIELRIRQLLERIDADDAADRLEQADAAFREFDRYYRPPVDRTKTREKEAYYKLRAIMDQVNQDYQSWNQIFSAFDLSRKLRESEMKRLKEMNAMISLEDTYDLIGELTQAVIEEVDDPRTLNAIKARFIQRLGPGYRGKIRGESEEAGIFEPDNLDSGKLLDTGVEGAYDFDALSHSDTDGGIEQG